MISKWILISILTINLVQFITGSGGSIIDDQNKDNMKTSENKRRKPDIKQFGLTKSKNTLTREEIINETDKMVKSKSFIGKELIQKIINVPTNLFWKVLGKIISTIPTIKNFYKSVDNNSNTSTSN